MLNLIVILTALTQGLVGLFVYQKKRNSAANISFALLSLASLAWAITNYIYTLNPVSGSALLITRLVLFWVVIQNTAFYIFANNFPGSKLVTPRKKLTIVLALSALIALLTLSPFVFSSVTIKAHQASPNPGFLIPLFMLHAVYTIGSGITSLLRKMRRAHGVEKKQFQFILFASVLNWVVVPITNFVITLAFQITFFARVSPFYTLVFASIIAYAIVAQKLFDIRAAVARSVAYLSIIATITLLYGVLLFGVIDLLLPGQNDQLLRQILSVILITPIALSFQRIKQFFDRATNRFFYRDAYDTQDVLDKLGNIAVSEIDLQRVLRETRATLNSVLRSSFIEFILFKNDRAYLEAHTHKRIDQTMLVLGASIKEQHKELVVVDELTSQTQLHTNFSEAGVALSLRLKTQQQTVGYIIFGEKKSGDIYSTQDKKLLVIVANELAIAVQNALRFEEIQNFNLTLQAKVDDATKLLRKANERLKALDETKDDFISMASHQLRTPLTSVKGYLSMVMEEDAGKISKMQREMLGQAFFSSQRMVYLIADLLNVSRLKTGKFIIEPTRVNLAKMVEQELGQLKETAASRNLKLTYEQPKDFPDVMLDETKTRQVIMNFADNAIYYTPSGGHINVRLIDTPTTVELRVEDDGIGVAKSEQQHLFTKFYRAGNARKARPDGTGLGLFMAKKVIIAEEGNLIFESEEGKGSTFGFAFSKAKVGIGKSTASAQPLEVKANDPIARQ